jgi:cell division protein FtsB
MGRPGARLVVLVLAALSLWLLVNFVGQVVVAARMDRQIADRQAENARIEAANEALKQRVGFAESPAYAEQIAREQLGAAREGDTVLLPTLPERKPERAVAAPVPVPAPPAQPNWRGWLHAFFPQDSHPTTQ